MKCKANIYAPCDGHNEGWIVEITDENGINTGLHYMGWPVDLEPLPALHVFALTEDFFPAEYTVDVFWLDRDRPHFKARVLDGKVIGHRFT